MTLAMSSTALSLRYVGRLMGSMAACATRVCATRAMPNQTHRHSVRSNQICHWLAVCILPIDSVPYNACLSGLAVTCHNSSGWVSLSRCLLSEAGFPADVLHLNDPDCTGTVHDGRVQFQFNNDDQKCGTLLKVRSKKKVRLLLMLQCQNFM